MPSTLDNETNQFQGYFGKVPTHGDFIGRGLPRSFREPWDTWLQNMISTTRLEMGERWMEYYLTCPAYHFVLSPGVCGKQVWLGVTIPCVDQVGRYYPMTLCRSLSASSNPFLAMKIHEDWFNEAESLVLSCLEDNFSLENFDQQVNRLGNDKQKGEGDATNLQSLVQQHQKNAWRITAASPIQGQSYPPLLNALLQKYCLAYSLWWTAGSDKVAPSMIIAQGLPPFEGVSAMLDGNWGQWGWENSRLLDCFSL